MKTLNVNIELDPVNDGAVFVENRFKKNLNLLPLLRSSGRGEENLLPKFKVNTVLIQRIRSICRLCVLFLVVYQSIFHFCLHVFQNMSIFAALFSPVTYQVTG